MKINTRLLPIKLHYFFFMGCLAPVLSFLMVLSRQLGIPVAIQGTLSALTLISTVVCKPFIATLADKYPKARKAIFVLLLIVMVTCYGSVFFIPRVIEAPSLRGRVLDGRESLEVESSSQTSGKTSAEVEGGALESRKNADEGGCQGIFVSFDTGEDCVASSGWDCRATSEAPAHTSSSSPNSTVTHNPLFPTSPVFNDSLRDTLYTLTLNRTQMLNLSLSLSTSLGSTSGEGMRLYQMASEMTTCDVSSLAQAGDMTLTCDGGEWTGDACQNVWGNLHFWAFALTTLFATISFSTANSVTDAICVDSLGEGRDYGNQRAWGSVSWGLMGPLSGFLVDTWSGEYSKTKTYDIAFVMLIVLGSLDVIIAVFSLNVPRLGKGGAVWSLVWQLLTQKRFFFFLVFVVIAGSLDGIVVRWIFVLQELMAERSGESMAHMKLLQGLTLFVQCSFEIPFMIACGPILRRLGTQLVISLVFFCYVIRLGSMALVSAFGPVWCTLLVEILSGPCYGLGYTAVIVHAGSLAPPGTSATVQSIVGICYVAIGYSIALFLGGVLFQSVGSPATYLIHTAIAILVFFLHVLSSWCDRAPVADSDPCPEQAAENTEVSFSERDGVKVDVCSTPSQNTYV